MSPITGWRAVAFAVIVGAVAVGSAAIVAPSGACAQIKALDNPADPVVALVDGVPILRSEVVQFHRSLPPQFQQMPLEMLFPTLIERMIDAKLIYEAGVKEKLNAEEDVKQRVRQYEERVVQEVYLGRMVSKVVTEDALRQRYAKVSKATPPHEEVSARHILVQTEAQAKEILAELRKGSDFAELARARSLDPAGRQQGGSLGWFSREDMVPEFSEAAFKLKEGELSATPVQSPYGWHIIKVEARRATAETFETMREKLATDMSQEVMGDTIGKLRKDAKIEKYNLDGSRGATVPGTRPPAVRR